MKPAHNRRRVSLDHAVALARDVRTDLLRRDETPRDLAGECGLAAMRVAAALSDPHVLRTGFYMKRRLYSGKGGRYPHRHAWCRVGPMIVDATATQFAWSHRAVHVVRADEDTRYIEIASGADAINDIMIDWDGRESEVYRRIARDLRRSLR